MRLLDVEAFQIEHTFASNLTLFGDDFPSLVLTITEESDTRLRVRVESPHHRLLKGAAGIRE